MNPEGFFLLFTYYLVYILFLKTLASSDLSEKLQLFIIFKTEQCFISAS